MPFIKLLTWLVVVCCLSFSSANAREVSSHPVGEKEVKEELNPLRYVAGSVLLLILIVWLCCRKGEEESEEETGSDESSAGRYDA